MSQNINIPEEYAVKESAVMEKRHWVRLTKTCNNHCLFCLDKDMHTGEILNSEMVRAEILRGAEDGGERLILSGGEPTIHPEFTDFIAYGRSVGFRRVQTISNGRMFAYRRFADKAIESGLDEATFSMHGHNPALHDYLVGVPGAFDQALHGLKNLLGRCVVNIDIVINKQNVAHVSDIMDFFMQFGIHEFDLLHIVPFGSTYPDNKDVLFYDIAENLDSLKKAFAHAYQPNRFIWTNRFPIHYLEGNETLIQDPHKLYDEVNGRRWMFEDFILNDNLLSCSGDRCGFCFIEKFCDGLTEIKKRLDTRNLGIVRIDANRYEQSAGIGAADFSRLRLKAKNAAAAAAFINKHGIASTELQLELEEYTDFNDGGFAGLERAVATDAASCNALFSTARDYQVQIYLNKDTAEWIDANAQLIAESPKPVLLSPENREILSEAAAADIDMREYFETRRPDNTILLDIPECIGRGLPHIAEPPPFDHSMLRANGTIDIDRFAAYYIVFMYYSKSVRCRTCRHDEGCRGLHVNYLRNFGFAQQQPVES